MPSIKDIAIACGVSAATVSHVLNSHYDEVGEETRERVLQAIRDMNYRPGKGNQHASPAASTLTIGVCGGDADQISLDTRHIFFRTMVVTISAVVDTLGYHTLLFSSRQMHRDPLRSIHTYCDGRCDGLVVVAPNVDPVLSACLRERGFPHVVIGIDDTNTFDACYSVDNAASAHMAVNELLRLGHRRIALCTGPPGFRSAEGRLEGYRKALLDASLLIEPQLVAPPLISPEEAYIWLRNLYRTNLPTAIFCFNDHYARAALRAAEELGIRVPRDLSIIGFDDLGASPTDLPLTTIRQPYEPLCDKAIADLVKMIRGEQIPPGQRVTMGQLIRRQSVSSPRLSKG